jgi:serine/threonine protein kinase
LTLAPRTWFYPLASLSVRQAVWHDVGELLAEVEMRNSRPVEAKGVAASHHAGVVHRDLKPSNIIAEPGVNLHQLKITDFGISTLTEEVFAQAAKNGDLTRSTSGTIRGALPYMAPEMMFRSPGDHPGSEADIWSLGARRELRSRRRIRWRSSLA